ncbi:MAG: response regulator transcription factor [Caldilineaceae bacterium]|nr:response regulator transcription factor [Caldilineaceae bacterium]
MNDKQQTLTNHQAIQSFIASGVRNGEKQVIFIAENDPNIADLIGSLMEQQGYQTQLTADYEEVTAQAGNSGTGAIVLDYTLIPADLPHDAQVLKSIQAPVLLMIPASQAEDLSQSPLLYLADDYITKPFSHRDLAMRIQRLLYYGKQQQRNASNNGYEQVVGNLRLDQRRRQAILGHEEIDLTPNEYRLLEVLMQAPNETIYKDELVEAVWQNRFYNDENVLRVTMRRLRSKIEPNPSKPIYLTTVYGKGYKLLYTNGHAKNSNIEQ